VVGFTTRSRPERTHASVSVVVPCLNEARNLPYVFARMPAVDEVVVVDGGSTDGSVARTRELWPSAKVIEQTRTGKGNALACGFAACTGEIVVMLDADGSTDPAEIPRFIEPLLSGADFAKGSRFLAGGGSSDITRLRRTGNVGLCTIVNRLFGTRYTDLCYGYNAFWRDMLPHMDLPDIWAAPPVPGEKFWGDGFEVETLINVRMARARMRVAEVPSMEAARLHGVSNLNAFGDGRRVLSTILQEYRRRRVPTVATAARHTPAPALVPPSATVSLLAATMPLPAAVPVPVPVPVSEPRPAGAAYVPIPRTVLDSDLSHETRGVTTGPEAVAFTGEV
jgi:glycosyltransferase involved in cell wall biosynthesis